MKPRQRRLRRLPHLTSDTAAARVVAEADLSRCLKGTDHLSWAGVYVANTRNLVRFAPSGSTVVVARFIRPAPARMLGASRRRV